MRVLFVTNMWPEEERPWFGTFIKSQAASLSELGLDVDVFYVRGYRTKRNYLHGAARTLAWNGGLDYDVVHGHYGHSALLGRLQVLKPYVISYCGDDLLGTPVGDGSLTLKSKIEVAVFRQLARVSDATITKSRQMETILPPATRERNHVIPNGVNTGHFTPMPREEALAQLGWDPDEHHILFAGNPEIERKNYPLAKETVELLQRDDPRARLHVGWGVSPDEIRAMMAASSALLHTSLAEGSPNVVKESMAMELPVVVVKVGDVEERLEGLPGCSVCDYDAAQLAEGLKRAIAHGRVPEARERISQLSTENVARRVLGIYESVLGASSNGNGNGRVR